MPLNVIRCYSALRIEYVRLYKCYVIRRAAINEFIRWHSIGAMVDSGNRGALRTNQQRSNSC